MQLQLKFKVEFAFQFGASERGGMWLSEGVCSAVHFIFIISCGLWTPFILIVVVVRSMIVLYILDLVEKCLLTFRSSVWRLHGNVNLAFFSSRFSYNQNAFVNRPRY